MRYIIDSSIYDIPTKEDIYIIQLTDINGKDIKFLRNICNELTSDVFEAIKFRAKEDAVDYIKYHILDDSDDKFDEYKLVQVLSIAKVQFDIVESFTGTRYDKDIKAQAKFKEYFGIETKKSSEEIFRYINKFIEELKDESDRPKIRVMDKNSKFRNF